MATPPSEHRRIALLCIAAAKPVLVEKPFADEAHAAQEMVEAARNSSVFCMEALWTRFLPLMGRLKQAVDDGEIGEPRVVTGSFCTPEIVDPDRNVFVEALGGGALLHRGIYPLSIASYILGPPEHVSSVASIGATGVDEESTVTGRHAGGGLSIALASLRTQAANDCVIMGTAGTIRIKPPIYRPYELTVTSTHPSSAGPPSMLRWEGLRESSPVHTAYQRLSRLKAVRPARGTRRLPAYYRGNGYHYEADEVKRCVLAGAIESEIMPLGETLRLAEVVTAARDQWRGSE